MCIFCSSSSSSSSSFLTLRPKVDIEVDAQIEGALAGEASLIILDTIELLMQSPMENVQSVLGKALEVLLLLMQRSQSTEVMKCVFSTQRAIVIKYPELIFYAETEQCAELCARLLQHCSSTVPEIRSWACASLYLLMRQNFEIGKVLFDRTFFLSSSVCPGFLLNS